MGFDEIEVTKYHGDKGIDLRGTLVISGGIEVKMAIQAKRWKNPVQAPEVQKVRGATSANERGMIITTSKFSAGARAEAERAGFTPVGLIDGEELIGLMVKHEIGVRRESQVVIELNESSL
jgi:restriction system protein